MTTFIVGIWSKVGVCGGYSVAWTRACKEIGSAEMPLAPRTESGVRERRYAKKRWLVASAALDPEYVSILPSLTAEKDNTYLAQVL
jgi:hypothetical protein